MNSMTGLLGSTVLEVAIGITFVYLLLAMLCSTVNEWISGLLNARASNLKEAIGELLNDQKMQDGKDFLQAFYGHPMITGLMKKGVHPSYILARSFAATLMDLATGSVQGSITFADLQKGIQDLPAGDVRTSLLTLIQNTQGSLERAQRDIEGWFNDTMDRASGWYRRRTQVWTILIAAAVTVAINADTLNIARHLWVDPTVRATIVAQAGAASSQGGTQQIDQLGQLMGWSATTLRNVDAWGWFMRITGWILTVIAVSMGAPFWFDVLNKFVNLRNTGRSPSESAKSPEKPLAPPGDKEA